MRPKAIFTNSLSTFAFVISATLPQYLINVCVSKSFMCPAEEVKLQQIYHKHWFEKVSSRVSLSKVVSKTECEMLTQQFHLVFTFI